MTTTTTIIIGPSTNVSRIKVPIEFRYVLDQNYQCRKVFKTDCPNLYRFIELIVKDYFVGVDLMFAYDDPNVRSNGSLYLGKWNDGVVE